MSRFRRVRDLSIVPPKQARAGAVVVADAEQQLATFPERGIPFSQAEDQKGIPFSAHAPQKGIPLSAALPKERIIPAVLAQDGHSLGEQALYRALWENGTAGPDETREITIGYRQMSDLAQLTVNNCKANVQSLLAKLSIEETGAFSYAHGRTFRVYSYAAILERRRAAGLTHIVRSRGVAFVDPKTGVPTVQRIKRGIPLSSPEKGIPLSQKTERGIPEGGIPLSKKGIPLSTGPSLFRLKSFRETTTSAREAVLAVLLTETGFGDAEAAERIVSECLRASSRVEPEAIVAEVQAQARRLRSRRVENPIGLLISQVPKAIKARQEHAQRGSPEAGKPGSPPGAYTPQKSREDYLAIANDPNASEQERRLARELASG